MPRIIDRLPAEARIWIPNARSQQLIDIRRLWIKMFGASTEVASWGSWTNDAGDIISEPVVVLSSFYNPLEVTKDSVVAFVQQVADILLRAGETTVLAYVEGSAWLYDGGRK